MLHLKSYVGSIVLAGLLFQGCSDAGNSDNTVAAVSQTQAQKSYKLSSDAFQGASAADKAQAQSDLTLKLTALNSDPDMQALVEQVKNENNLTTAEANTAIAQAIVGSSTTAQNGPSRGFLSKITDKVKNALVKVLDNPVGDKITGAAFDVVLNSKGVTVVMIDLARKSNTVSDVMVNALEANWGLTAKMCPMLSKGL